MLAGAERLGDLDGVQHVAQGLLADGRRWIAERAEFVLLILKEVGVDGAGADAEFALQGLDFGHVAEAVGQIPEHVQGHRGRDAGEAVDLGRVGEFFFDGGSGGGLHKLAKARAGVGESPGGNLDLERIQGLSGLFESCGFRMLPWWFTLPSGAGLRRFQFRNFGGAISSCTRITWRNRGPWTPLMRVISMSAVALGPEIQVTSRQRRLALAAAQSIRAASPQPGWRAE